MVKLIFGFVSEKVVDLLDRISAKNWHREFSCYSCGSDEC